MTLEAKLAGWTGPSSDTERDKQARTERMVREAVKAYSAFQGFNFRVYAKGSYPNNTNVRTDSDVDIAVQCREAIYRGGTPEVTLPSYTGPWTPSVLRSEVEKALRVKFPGQVDVSGTVAIRVATSSARVNADVVPCFTYKYYFGLDNCREGTAIFKKDGSRIENYPQQHLELGRSTNLDTSHQFKKAVRILKRVGNAMAADQIHKEVPSFFIECLVYNCPDRLFSLPTWTDRINRMLFRIWDSTQGDIEPEDNARWLEVNKCKYLFAPGQAWTRHRCARVLKSGLELPWIRIVMIWRPFTQIVAAVVALVFAAGLWLSGSAVDVTWLRYYSIAVLAATLILTAWDRWLWRLPLLQHLDLVPPKVFGTWRGTLKSAWVDPATGATTSPKDRLFGRSTETLIRLGCAPNGRVAIKLNLRARSEFQRYRIS